MKLYYPAPTRFRRPALQAQVVIDFENDFRRWPTFNHVTLVGDDGYAAGAAAYSLNAHERCVLVLSNGGYIIASPRGVNAYLQRLGQPSLEELHDHVVEPEDGDYDDPE